MKINNATDVYIDYLLSQNSYATATGCSDLLDNIVQHDTFSRLLAVSDFDSKYLWLNSKKVVLKAKSNNDIIILDHTVSEKAHSAQSELINYHYDNSEKRVVKGISLVTCVLQNKNMCLPVSYYPVIKDQICLKKNKKGKTVQCSKSRYTINEMARAMIKTCIHNQLSFKYILGDCWFSSKDNLAFFHKEKVKFILSLSRIRLVSETKISAKKGNYKSVSTIGLKNGESRLVYLKNVNFPIMVTRKVFKEGDAKEGDIYLVTNDLSLMGDHIYDIYQRRWDIETFHRSIKNNASLTGSPTSTKKTQLNHICLSMIAIVRIESMKIVSNKNHYAIKRKLLISANQASYKELQKLKLKYQLVA